MVLVIRLADGICVGLLIFCCTHGITFTGLPYGAVTIVSCFALVLRVSFFVGQFTVRFSVIVSELPVVQKRGTVRQYHSRLAWPAS